MPKDKDFLNPDISGVVGGYLNPEEQRNFAHAHKGYRENDFPNKHFFQPERTQKVLHKFLTCVMRGEYEKVVRLLKTSPEYLMNSGDAEDYSGRVFKDVTAIQYACWAGDADMLELLLSHIPKDETGDEIRASVKAQIEVVDVVDKEGITYTLNGEVHQEQHYNHKALTDAYDNYLAEYDKASPDWSMVEKLWLLIGEAQCNVPVFVAHHYCNPDESFESTPKFDKPLRVRSLEFNNWMAGGLRLWFPVSQLKDSSLGRDFSIFRAWHRTALPGPLRPRGRGCGWAGVRARLDLAAITTLFKVKTLKLEQLKEHYLNPQPASDLPTKKGP